MRVHLNGKAMQEAKLRLERLATKHHHSVSFSVMSLRWRIFDQERKIVAREGRRPGFTFEEALAFFQAPPSEK